MSKRSFSEMPLVVRGAAAATGFMAWVLFAELIIDRHGLDRWLPFYRLGNFCVYDAVAIILIGAVYAILMRGMR